MICSRVYCWEDWQARLVPRNLPFLERASAISISRWSYRAIIIKWCLEEKIIIPEMFWEQHTPYPMVVLLLFYTHIQDRRPFHSGRPSPWSGPTLVKLTKMGQCPSLLFPALSCLGLLWSPLLCLLLLAWTLLTLEALSDGLTLSSPIWRRSVICHCVGGDVEP